MILYWIKLYKSRWNDMYCIYVL